VFTHPHSPEAGVQVPAGTVEKDETPNEAILREAYEETGLKRLKIRQFLGTREYDFSNSGQSERHRWHFYHLELEGTATATWRHFEQHPSDGSSKPIEFEFHWVNVTDKIKLAPHQGDLLDSLRHRSIDIDSS